MHIHITGPAAERLHALSGSPDTMFKLVYDAEGCGCAVSGVPSLWMLDRSAMLQSDLTAASEPMIVYERRHEVFYEDQLTLDYDPDRRRFRLSSNSQIYASDLPVVDRR
jgi:uncharacterized protein YqkB